MSNSLGPHGLYSPWNSSGQNTGVGSLSLLQGIFPTQGIKPRSPALRADSLLAEPPGKPKNTGVGSLSLLQQIFLTQESNKGLLHCRQILSQLSYGGSPVRTKLDPDHLHQLGHRWVGLVKHVLIQPCLPSICLQDKQGWKYEFEI